MFGLGRKKKKKGPQTLSGDEISQALNGLESRFRRTQSSVSVPALEPAQQEQPSEAEPLMPSRPILQPVGQGT